MKYIAILIWMIIVVVLWIIATIIVVIWNLSFRNVSNPREFYRMMNGGAKDIFHNPPFTRPQ